MIVINVLVEVILWWDCGEMLIRASSWPQEDKRCLILGMQILNQ